MQTTLEQLAVEAMQGSQISLEEMVRRIQDRIYGLALRMLSYPADAEDATQEILIKVITNLKGFRFEGSLKSWVFRIAANHLNSTRKTRMEKREISMETAGQYIDQAEARGWLSEPPPAPEPLLEIEMRLLCIQAVLMALDRTHRMAFILGDVMELTGSEGAYIMEITPETFRKRLSRARRRLRDFLSVNCSLIKSANRCNCPGALANNLQNGWIVPNKTLLASRKEECETTSKLADYLKELDELSRVSALYKSFPASHSPTDFSVMIKGIINDEEYRVLSDQAAP